MPESRGSSVTRNKFDVEGFSSWRRVMAFFSRRTADALLFRKLSFYGDGRVQEVLAEDASANQGLQKDWFQS